MIFFMILSALAQDPCNQSLLSSYAFSDYSIAKAIEELGGKEGVIFSYAIRGYAYETVAKKYDVDPDLVVAITRRGVTIADKYRREGL